MFHGESDKNSGISGAKERDLCRKGYRIHVDIGFKADKKRWMDVARGRG